MIITKCKKGKKIQEGNEQTLKWLGTKLIYFELITHTYKKVPNIIFNARKIETRCIHQKLSQKYNFENVYEKTKITINK